MSFKSDIPNYASLTSEEYEMHCIPSGARSQFEGLVQRTAQIYEDEAAEFLFGILNRFAAIVPCSPASNWGYRTLVQNDLPDISSAIFRSNFDVFMACLDVLLENGLPPNDVNNYLENFNIGYEYYYDQEAETYYWQPRDSNAKVIGGMEETQERVKDYSEQAEENIEQAIKCMGGAKTDKERKDIVWQLVGAMEAIVKTMGGENDIASATHKLRNTGLWGEDCIVKDGLSIFHYMHKLYPDLRHGSTERSSMGEEEAYYWIERTCCCMRYLCRMANKNGIKPIC